MLCRAAVLCCVLRAGEWSSGSGAGNWPRLWDSIKGVWASKVRPGDASSTRNNPCSYCPPSQEEEGVIPAPKPFTPCS